MTTESERAAGATLAGRAPAALRRAYEEDGYFVVPSAFAGRELELMRREADLGVEEEDRRMRRGDAAFVPVTVAGDRYVVSGRARTHEALAQLLRGEALAGICAAALGDAAYLFSETFVVKMANNAHGWPWHQDFGYLEFHGCGHYPPNLSAWIALDDMTEENGALRVLPFGRAGTRRVVHHDLAGSWDAREVLPVDLTRERGVLLEVPAGSVVALSGAVFHASDPNRSDRMRRAYLAQYSAQPVLKNGKPVELAIPVLGPGAGAGPSTVRS